MSESNRPVRAARPGNANRSAQRPSIPRKGEAALDPASGTCDQLTRPSNDTLMQRFWHVLALRYSLHYRLDVQRTNSPKIPPAKQNGRCPCGTGRLPCKRTLQRRTSLQEGCTRRAVQPNASGLIVNRSAPPPSAPKRLVQSYPWRALRNARRTCRQRCQDAPSRSLARIPLRPGPYGRLV